MHLTHRSSLLTTFNMEFRKIPLEMLPFHLKMSQDVENGQDVRKKSQHSVYPQ